MNQGVAAFGYAAGFKAAGQSGETRLVSLYGQGRKPTLNSGFWVSLIIALAYLRGVCSHCRANVAARYVLCGLSDFCDVCDYNLWFDLK